MVDIRENHRWRIEYGAWCRMSDTRVPPHPLDPEWPFRAGAWPADQIAFALEVLRNGGRRRLDALADGRCASCLASDSPRVFAMTYITRDGEVWPCWLCRSCFDRAHASETERRAIAEVVALRFEPTGGRA